MMCHPHDLLPQVSTMWLRFSRRGGAGEVPELEMWRGGEEV